ncbi:MAG: (d)CMP kinase [Bacteroidales bacterium]
MIKRKIIIAIDGYSSCGKSSFARAIAREMQYIYIDSGAMYRSVTLYCMRKGYASELAINAAGVISCLPEININFVYNPDLGEHETFLNSENVEKEIRGIEVSGLVSAKVRIQEVRERMVELQRQIGVFKGIVMDGRDIGTVVFPDAELKIFMTASVDVRAKRRYDELVSKGIKTDYEEAEEEYYGDIADENRDISPLRRADDAVVLDNSRMTIPDQMEWIMKLIETRLHAG